MSVLRSFVTRICILFGLVFVVWQVALATPLREQLWWLQLSEVVGVWSLAPLPLLLTSALLARSRWALVALALPVLWFARDYGQQFVPSLAEPAHAGSAAQQLRVMTFNTWRQDDGQERFAEAVTRWEPDIVALQEVSPRLEYALAGLKEEWPYQFVAPVRAKTRIAVLSKVPILSYEEDNRLNGCHCVNVRLGRGEETVRLFVVHVRSPELGEGNRAGRPLRPHDFDTSEQAAAFAALLPLLEASDEPTIVVGDFNTTERQPGYRQIQSAGFQNAHEVAGFGFGFTYPAPFTRVGWLPFPMIRIDHVFSDAAWRAVATFTTPLMGSDHQALVVDLQRIEPP